MTFLEVSTEDQIAIVEALAREIWTEHYTPIIGSGQVAYMLDRFQSREAIAAQIGEGYLYYLMTDGPDRVGYLAAQPRGKMLFLSKIYVKTPLQRKGYGRSAIKFVESLARSRGLAGIVLTVNRNNRNALAAYERTGFTRTRELVQDIGSGYVMDDYEMKKILGPREKA